MTPQLTAAEYFEYGRTYTRNLLRRREAAFGRAVAVEWAQQFLTYEPQNDRERGMDAACREYLASTEEAL